MNRSRLIRAVFHILLLGYTRGDAVVAATMRDPGVQLYASLYFIILGTHFIVLAMYYCMFIVLGTYYFMFAFYCSVLFTFYCIVLYYCIVLLYRFCLYQKDYCHRVQTQLQ
jgi:hypothetical protein